MRILLSGGGTGGHVYPVLTVIEHLRAEARNGGNLELLYLGMKDSFEERLSQRYGVPFAAVSSGQVRGMSVLTRLQSGVRLSRGVLQSFRRISAFRPQVTFVTGGYVSVPVVLASWLLGCPILIYLPDMEPGLAIRALYRLAQRVAVSFEETLAYVPGKGVVTGYPVRADFFRATRERARERLGLRSDLPVLLVLGGSRAAQSLNQAVASNLDALLAEAQIIHISGTADHPVLEEKRRALHNGQQARYRVYAYLHEELADAMAAADLAVARAGAATLAEFPAAGLPAILVPYPYSGQHQEVNADYMVRHGAARKIADSRLQEELLPQVRELLHNPALLGEMREAARRMACPDAAHRIATLLRQLAAGKTVETAPEGVSG